MGCRVHSITSHLRGQAPEAALSCGGETDGHCRPISLSQGPPWEPVAGGLPVNKPGLILRLPRGAAQGPLMLGTLPWGQRSSSGDKHGAPRAPERFTGTEGWLKRAPGN